MDERTTLPLIEAVRSRPGMYVGDCGRLGCLRVISAVLEQVVTLSSSLWHYDGRDGYTNHAYLDVSVIGANVLILIDFHKDDAPDFKHRIDLLSKEMCQPQVETDRALSVGLTDGLRIFGGAQKTYSKAFLNDPAHRAVLRDRLQKNRFVAAHFDIHNAIDPKGISQDLLSGYLSSRCEKWPGLVLRNVFFRACSNTF